MTVATWQESRADAIDVEVENIEFTLLRIKALDGLYDERPEIKEALRVAYNLLTIDAENRRQKADRLRVESRPEIAV